MRDETNPEPLICPGCGQAFACGVEAGLESCWCMDLPPPPPGSAPQAGVGCYCRACLLKKREAPPPQAA